MPPPCLCLTRTHPVASSPSAGVVCGKEILEPLCRNLYLWKKLISWQIPVLSCKKNTTGNIWGQPVDTCHRIYLPVPVWHIYILFNFKNEKRTLNSGDFKLKLHSLWRALRALACLPPPTYMNSSTGSFLPAMEQKDTGRRRLIKWGVLVVCAPK